MPGKLLLLTSDAVYRPLRRFGRLPDALLRNPPIDDLLDAIERPTPVGNTGLVHCDPDALLGLNGQRDVLGPRGRSEVFNALLNDTICYVATVGASPTPPVVDQVASDDDESPDEAAANEPVDNEAPPDAAEPEDAPEVPRSLTEHAAYYAQVRREIDERARDRSDHFRHVLILICHDNPANDDLDALNALIAAEGDDKLFDLAYVILDELEPGRNAYFNGEFVWPIAVGRLLVKLLHDDFKQPRKRTAARAWRAFELAPGIELPVKQKLCDRQFKRLREALIDPADLQFAADVSRFRAPSADAGVRLSEPQREANEDALQQTWLDINPHDRLDEAEDAELWEPQLVKAGDAFSRELSSAVLDNDPPARREVARIWSAVHADPRQVNAALDSFRTDDGKAIDERYEQVRGHWQRIVDLDQQRLAHMEDARRCADTLTQAQGGFMGLGERLIATGVVIMAVGYLTMQILPGYVMPILVALGGAFAAFMAGFVTWDFEQRAGRRGRDAIDETARDIEARMRDRHEACQSAVRSAHVFWQQLRADAASDRLKRLLRRLQAILDHALRVDADLFSIEEDDDAPQTSPEQAAQLAHDPAYHEKIARRQRRRFVDKTVLEQPVDVKDLTEETSAHLIDERVDEHIGRFRDELWTAFCREHDPKQAGRLPARLLIPMLEQFAESFEADLLSIVHRLAIERISGRGTDEWVAQVRAIIEYQAYYELMSCRVLSHQTDHARFKPVLYVRADFPRDTLAQQLGGAGVAQPAITSPLLEHMPTVALMFQEMPVRFGPGERGRVVVKEYDERDEA